VRKLAIAILLIVILIVAALLVAPQFINVNRYHDRIQAELQQRLNRPVHLGRMHLTLLPPRFGVENAVIGEDSSFGQNPFLTVQQLFIAVKFWPLLQKNIEVRSLNLQRPHIELIRNSQGQWNFSTIGPSQPPAPPSAQSQPAPQQTPSSPASPPAQALPFQLDNLKITDGQIAFTNYQRRQSRAVYDHIDLVLTHFAPDKQFDFALAAHLPGKGTQTVSLAGTAGPVNPSNAIATPFDGALKLDQVSIDGVLKFLNRPSLSGMAGIISGSTKIKNANANVSGEGSLRVDQPVVNGVSIGYPISLDYKASDDLNRDIIHIANANLHLGSTPLAISGTLNPRPAPAQVDLKVNAKDVSLAEAARLAAALGVAFNANAKVDGRASADIAAKGALNHPALNGAVFLRNLVISGQDVPQPVKIQTLDLALTPQQVRSSEFTATSGQTSLGAQFTLTGYTAPTPSLTAALRTQNSQIADLLSMARAYGVSAVNGITGSGLLSLDVHVAGPLKNVSAMSVNGTGQMQNASLKPSSWHAPLNVKNANLSFSNHATQLQNLAASLGQTNANGHLTIRDFSAPNVQFTLTADKVNLTELQQITALPSAPAPPGAAPRQSSSLSLLPPALAQTAAPRQANASVAAPAGAEILQKMTGGGTVQIGTLQNDQLVLNNVRANVTLNHGVIGLSPLTAQLYDGLQNGAITIDTRTTPLSVQVQSSLQRVQANPLISSVTSIKNTIYGLLAANSQLSFQGTNPNEIARTLNGTLALDLTNGRIAKLDLLNQLAAIGKFAGVRKSAEAVTDVAKLTGHFNVSHGVATTNDLQAQIANGTLAATGLVNLATQELNLHLTAVLSKGFTQQVGGTNAGGFMQTALANSRGELVIPVIITGTFDHPQVAPDLQKIAQMKLQNLLPTTGNPAASTAGILGQVFKGGSPGQAGGLGGIIGAIGQRQQPQQQQQPQQPSEQQRRQPANQIDQALQGIFGKKNQQK
jgi:uncharacterized protein involved in outer membrane biogenesis